MTDSSTHQARRAASLAGIKQQEEAVSKDKPIPERWRFAYQRGAQGFVDQVFEELGAAEAALSEAQQELQAAKSLCDDKQARIKEAEDLSWNNWRQREEAYAELRLANRERDDAMIALSKLRQQVTQQAATIAEVQKELDEANRTIERCEVCGWCACTRKHEEGLLAQQADTIIQLSNDLRKYGLHRADCQGTGRFCTCGFRAALASLPK